MNRQIIDYTNQDFFLGIDVHKKSWKVTVSLVEGLTKGSAPAFMAVGKALWRSGYVVMSNTSVKPGTG